MGQKDVKGIPQPIPAQEGALLRRPWPSMRRGTMKGIPFEVPFLILRAEKYLAGVPPPLGLGAIKGEEKWGHKDRGVLGLS